SDALLALDDLPDHLVEASGEAGKLVLAPDADLDVLASGEATGGLVEAGKRLRDVSRGPPGRETDEKQPEQRHHPERQLKLAGVGHRARLRIGEEQDGALLVREGRQGLG